VNNTVPPLILAVSQSARPLPGNVSNQSATQGHIEDLVPSTNRQQWFALTKHFVDHQQFPQIPFS
jgi:hypothetical protein